MKTFFPLSILLFVAFVLNGCIIFHKMSYTININKDNDTTGTATVIVSDIRSDAAASSNLETDKKNLFEYVLKSPDFISQMKDEGKNITNRVLFLQGDTLMGKADYSFASIFNVEKIQYQDGFYYLTLTLDDSVLTTNGQIINSKDHKRILWDKSFKVLKFEMLGFPFKKDEYTRLAPFFNPKK